MNKKNTIFLLFSTILLSNWNTTNFREYYYPIDEIVNNPVVYIYHRYSYDIETDEVFEKQRFYAVFEATTKWQDTLLTVNVYDENFDYVYQWIDKIDSYGVTFQNSDQIKYSNNSFYPFLFRDDDSFFFEALSSDSLAIRAQGTFKAGFNKKYKGKTEELVGILIEEEIIEDGYSGKVYRYFKRGTGQVIANYIFDDMKIKELLNKIISKKEFDRLNPNFKEEDHWEYKDWDER